jgi:hypothetical protein
MPAQPTGPRLSKGGRKLGARPQAAKKAGAGKPRIWEFRILSGALHAHHGTDFDFAQILLQALVLSSQFLVLRSHRVSFCFRTRALEKRRCLQRRYHILVAISSAWKSKCLRAAKVHRWCRNLPRHMQFSKSLLLTGGSETRPPGFRHHFRIC